MKYTNIKLTKEEALKALTILEKEGEEFKKLLEDENPTIRLIAKNWIEDINQMTKKIDQAIKEFYKAPF